MPPSKEYFVDESAVIEAGVVVGDGTKIWGYTRVRTGAKIGAKCVLGRGVYIDREVTIGNKCKIQNGAQIYSPSEIEDGVFIGPGVIFTNDHLPRALNMLGDLKSSSDWEQVGVKVQEGASLGAGVICVAPVNVGRWSMIGAGAIVTENVPDFALMIGVPAKRIGWVSEAGIRLFPSNTNKENWICPKTDFRYRESEGVLKRIDE